MPHDAGPGSQDPAIEIRGDIVATLILFDVNGELIVVRAALGGHDAASGAKAWACGYANSSQGNMGLLHLLQVNNKIRFDTVAPSASPTTSPGAGTTIEPPSALIIEEAGNLSSVGRTYTSDRFLPQTTFDIGFPRGRAEVCVSPQTSERTIVLRHVRGCVQDVRIIRPFAVDCGLADSHPGADALTAAILRRLGAAAREELDLAKLGKPAPVNTLVPWGLLPGTEHRRVIETLRSRPFDAAATDLDGCRLLPEPGSRDPVIEIRGDIYATFVFLDIDNELVVVRASVGGYDAVSGSRGARLRVDGSGGDAALAPDRQQHPLRLTGPRGA